MKTNRQIDSDWAIALVRLYRADYVLKVLEDPTTLTDTELGEVHIEMSAIAAERLEEAEA